MADGVLEEEEIEWAMGHNFPNWSGGVLGMRTEHLKSWLAAAQAHITRVRSEDRVI